MAGKAKSVTLPVLNQDGEKISKVLVSVDVFGIEPNKQVMFDAVQVYQANMRQATAKTLRRDEVSGGGKKPWRQKGTGRARAGSSRSPLWRGGGCVFGPTGNQNYKLSMNKEAHRLALRSALSAKQAEGGIIVVDEFKLEAPKTSVMVEILEKINKNETDTSFFAYSCASVFCCCSRKKLLSTFRVGLCQRDTDAYSRRRTFRWCYSSVCRAV